MAKRTTLNDIAQEVGLSVSIVSRVLNGKECRISSESRARILEVAKKKNYIPNQIARGLVSQRSNTFGLITPSIESSLFTSIINGLEKVCRANGYGFFITNSGNTLSGDLELIDLLVARGVDGIFIVPSNEAYARPELPERLKGMEIPYVLLHRSLKEFSCNIVMYDNELGGYLATKYLIENGHTKIACVSNAEGSNTSVLRAEGYLRAMEEAGLKPSPEHIIQSPYTMMGGYEAGKQLRRTDATAVFAASDYIALGIRKAYFEAGKVAPRHFSIVTFDQSESDFIIDPPMTAIVQDMDKLSEDAFAIMQGVLDGGNEAVTELLLSPSLAIRGTVGRA